MQRTPEDPSELYGRIDFSHIDASARPQFDKEPFIRGFFIRHANEELWLANGTGSGRNSSINFLEDTTWWGVPAWVEPPSITP